MRMAMARTKRASTKSPRHAINGNQIEEQEHIDNISNPTEVESDLQRERNAVKSGMRFVKTILIVLGVFCGCWFPFLTLVVIQIYGNIYTVSMTMYTNIAGYLAMGNSLMNPIIYSIRMETFQGALFRLLGRDRQSRENFQ